MDEKDMPRLSISHSTPTTAVLNGREVLSFGGCNYLGLAHHPAIHAALLDALQTFGLSTSASRETTGNTTAHDALESALTRFLGFPSGVVVPDGYTANLAIAQALAPTHPVALIDARAHKSIWEAATGARMHLVEYDHLDASHAAELIAKHASRGVAVFTDGVFTADGALAPIPDLLAALPPAGGPNFQAGPASSSFYKNSPLHDLPPAVLVIDDCHGLCTLGPRGQGTHSHFAPGGAGFHPGPVSFPISDPRLALTTTLAKGLGCHGGIVAGPAWLADLVRSRASAYICTTPVSPAIAAAATEALAVLSREPDRVPRLHTNVALLSSALQSLGLNIPASPSPIFAFTLGTEQTMRRLYADLLADGILAPLISYPGGPAPVYFRLSITSQHSPEHIDRLVSALATRLQPAVPVKVAG